MVVHYTCYYVVWGRGVEVGKVREEGRGDVRGVLGREGHPFSDSIWWAIVLFIKHSLTVG